ncbi:MAG: sialidase family protein [Candidatus Cryptobacteroides sp.]|nr:sialidase family protein [Candidatus Cryptobacteroides sp.]
MNRLSILLLLAGSILPAAAATSPKGDIRIAWDYFSRQEMAITPVCNASYKVEPNLYYPRAKHLQDGSILLTFENDHFGWDIYCRRSFDGGKTWTDATLLRHSHPAESTVGKDIKVFVNPDFIQLRSGRILLAWQWRYHNGYNDLPNTNRNCGVELCYSDDSGASWSKPVEVYRGRCWEPAFLELPSGEIHMYITDSQEIRDRGSYACTSILRSFDGGKTWQGKEMALNTDVEPISRTIWNGRGMDGMPTAVLLQDGKTIVVPLETWSGRDVYDISPVIVRSSNNWAVDGASIREKGGPEYPAKKQVNKDLKAFGPYSCLLPSGEMVILTNGRYKSENGVFVLIGDRDGDNFSYVTNAFPNSGGYWGSIDALNGNELLATCTVRSNSGPMPAAGDGTVGQISGSRGKILLVKGWLNRSRRIPAGPLKLRNLSEFSREGLWMLGKNHPSTVYADFGYDRDCFSFASYVFDENLASYSPENSDAAQILLSRGKKGTYKITVNAKGDYTVYKEENSAWKLLCWEYGKAEVELDGTLNDDTPDRAYSALLSLNWKLLGGRPSKGESLRVHLRHYYKDGPKVKSGLYVEDTEGEDSDNPEEWLEVKLI